MAALFFTGGVDFEADFEALSTTTGPSPLPLVNTTGSSLCPMHFDCSNVNDDTYRSIDTGIAPSIIAIVSGFLSCLGSLLIFSALLVKDLRSHAQIIISWLALADFISAAGYIVGSINYILHFNLNQTDHNLNRSCKVFDKLCRAQSTFTTWSSLVSFAWTTVLAFYFYMLIVYTRKLFAWKWTRLIVTLLSWFGPLLIVVPLVIFDKLGFAHYAASNWCFVKSETYSKQPLNTDRYISVGYVLVAGKFWEMLTYIIVIVVYVHILRHLSKFRGYDEVNDADQAKKKAERRLKYIPIIFLILRMWGTIGFIVSVAAQSTKKGQHGGCIPSALWYINMALQLLQAIGDPGQGWGNAILYIFMSDVIREKLIIKPFRICIYNCGVKLQELAGERVVDGRTERGRGPEDNYEVRNHARGEETSITDVGQRYRSPYQHRRPYATCSTISQTITDMPARLGPIDNEARPIGSTPKHSPVGSLRRLNGSKLSVIVSETTTTSQYGADAPGLYQQQAAVNDIDKLQHSINVDT